MTAPALRCADASENRAEPLYGTASHVKRWLLLEQPGSWGRDALMQSGVPERVARELSRRAASAGIRVILIRRGVRFVDEGRQCYFARTEQHANHLSHMTLGSAADLLDIDLEPLASGGEVAGAEPCPDPVFLVCTHGKRDACCSVRGNAVSRIACTQSDRDAWESAHIGGDRFAANLVCFPHGLYYGRVSPDEVTELMDNFSSGLMSLDHYRGRSCSIFPVQAAEYFLRRELDLTRLDDVVSIEGPYSRGNTVRARFTLGDGRNADVGVAVTQGPERALLTCNSEAPSLIPHYGFVTCDVIGADKA